MTRRAVPVPLLLVVLIVPLLWLWGMVEEYGIESHPFSSGTGAVGRTQIGLFIGVVTGLWAGCSARRASLVQLAFTLLVLVAGVNSWWVMFIVVALNSTSGYGLEPGYVVGTALSWVLAFAAFFSAAWVVRWRSPAREAEQAGSSCP